MAYYCYILECADGSYYTGWTLDPVRREKQHTRDEAQNIHASTGLFTLFISKNSPTIPVH